MKNVYRGFYPLLFISFFICSHTLLSCKNSVVEKTEIKEEKNREEENEGYDGPDKAAEFEFMRTKDPALGYVPTDRLLAAQQITNELKVNYASRTSGYGNWTERGPVSDIVGPSNGNSRANSGVAAGRVRAILVDAGDATGKTVFVAGVDGGIWKTTDITASPAGWILINDFMNNLAITALTQDPTNGNIMYCCTGEAYFNAEAVQGAGVFKSTDRGITWSLLPSSSTFTYCTRILCDYQGNVYLATRNGLKRSVNGGTAWTDITPTGMSVRICDLEISSTTVAGRLHVVGGIFTAQSYRYTDIPITVAAGGWAAPTTAFPSFNDRAEIAVSGNTLYALPADNSYQVPRIYKSTNGGATWASTGGQPAGTWASGQGWYALSVDINPADPNQCIVGGLDTWKTTNGGTSWTKISTWVGAGQYVHADQHKVLWYNNGNKLLFACDGGVHFSSDGGTTIRDRNVGLRIKQLYSVASHPTNVDYYIAGAQDNGTHQYKNPGLSTTTEITGGDGAFVQIDQNQPQYQFGAYVYNQYRRSTDGGATWSSVNISGTVGQFINPFVYDDAANIIYCSSTAGTYKRWTNPQTGATNADITITALNGNSVSALAVSPYTANRVYLGTYNDVSTNRLCYVNTANTTASGSAGVNISAGLPTNTDVSCIATGTNDANLMVCYSNYGVQQIWVSTNTGTTWTNIDGNLPDMPVRWCMFVPGNNTKAIIATETGVWITDLINGASTSWAPSPTFPTVRTDMLSYRASDGTIAAATHGRGLWTQPYLTIVPLNNFILKGSRTGNNVDLSWTFESTLPGSSFEIETSADGIHYASVGSQQWSFLSKYSFQYTPPAGQPLYYRIKEKEQTGLIKYSNIVRLAINTSISGLEIINLYPNPAKDNLSVSFNAAEKGKLNYIITSVTGQVVLRKEQTILNAGNYSNTENVQSLRPGSYIFTVLLNGQKVSKAFTKQ